MNVRRARPWEFAWLVERTGMAPRSDVVGLVAVADEQLRGMVAFDQWALGSAMVHIALETPAAARRLLPMAARYLFDECGRAMALGMISSANLPSLRLAQHAGFTCEHRVKDGIKPGVDIVLMRLARADCPWVARPHQARYGGVEATGRAHVR